MERYVTRPIGRGEKLMSNIEQAKETWAEYQAESSFEDWKFVAEILREHFFSQVEDMTEKELLEKFS